MTEGRGTDTLEVLGLHERGAREPGFRPGHGDQRLQQHRSSPGRCRRATTLVGSNSTNSWDVTDDNDGTGVQRKTFTFTKVGNPTGGIGIDTFSLDDGVKLVGTLDGGIGTNTLNCGEYSGYATVNITGNNAGNLHEQGVDGTIASFKGIGSFVGIAAE